MCLTYAGCGIGLIITNSVIGLSKDDAYWFFLALPVTMVMDGVIFLLRK